MPVSPLIDGVHACTHLKRQYLGGYTAQMYLLSVPLHLFWSNFPSCQSRSPASHHKFPSCLSFLIKCSLISGRTNRLYGLPSCAIQPMSQLISPLSWGIFCWMSPVLWYLNCLDQTFHEQSKNEDKRGLLFPGIFHCRVVKKKKKKPRIQTLFCY